MDWISPLDWKSNPMGETLEVPTIGSQTFMGRPFKGASVLTRAPLGGGGRNDLPSTFPSIAQKRKGVGLRNFREPLPTSILHMLTKGKFHTYDRSAVSDVRVTSCSAILGKK